MGKLFIANEVIDFQTTMFGKELEGVFTSIKGKYVTSDAASKATETKVFEAIIKKYTNLNVDFKLANSGNAANASYLNIMTDINIKDIVKNTIISRWSRDEDVNSIRNILKNLAESSEKNKIDLKNNKVYGYFKDIPVVISINIDFINNPKFTPGMLAALILHEVGHTFTALELLGNTIYVNQYLSIASAGLSSKNPEVKEYMIKELSNVLTDEEYIDALKELTDTSAIIGVLIKALHMTNLRDKRFSIFNTPEYDSNYGEALADTYAVRMGYGRQSVEAQREMEILYGGPTHSIKNRITYRMFTKVSILIQAGLLIPSIIALSSLPVLGSVMVPSLLMMILYNISSFTTRSRIKAENSYDLPEDRVKRIRDQIVTQLKYDLDPTLANEILEDLKKVDEIIATYKPYGVIMNRIADFIFKSSGSRYKNAVRLQQDLEQLVANDFFIKATQLKLM